MMAMISFIAPPFLQEHGTETTCPAPPHMVAWLLHDLAPPRLLTRRQRVHVCFLSVRERFAIGWRESTPSNVKMECVPTLGTIHANEHHYKSRTCAVDRPRL